MEKKPQIKVTKDGPLRVTGNIPLYEETAKTDLVFPTHWEKGKDFPEKQTYLLCRCGASKTKPYCDGAHSDIEFDGTETARDIPFMNQARIYPGPTLDLADAEGLCSGARFCERAGGTWKLTERSDDPSARATAIDQSMNCPSGRLVAIDKESGTPIEPPFPPSISVTQDPGADVAGPLYVKGGVPVVSEEGTTYEIRNRVTLCRCGASKNKPFCDGRHVDIQFRE